MICELILSHRLLKVFGEGTEIYEYHKARKEYLTKKLFGGDKDEDIK